MNKFILSLCENSTENKKVTSLSYQPRADRVQSSSSFCPYFSVIFLDLMHCGMFKIINKLNPTNKIKTTSKNSFERGTSLKSTYFSMQDALDSRENTGYFIAQNTNLTRKNTFIIIYSKLSDQK